LQREGLARTTNGELPLAVVVVVVVDERDVLDSAVAGLELPVPSAVVVAAVPFAGRTEPSVPVVVVVVVVPVVVVAAAVVVVAAAAEDDRGQLALLEAHHYHLQAADEHPPGSLQEQ
jgi:hypothetical protein